MPTISDPASARPKRLRVPLQMVEASHRVVDRRMADLAADGAALGLRILCGPGCAACCAYLANAPMAECEIVAEAIQAMPIEERQVVVDRLYAWCAAFHIFSPGELFVEDEQRIIAWQVQRIGCPMLDPETYRCTVYAARPIPCRTHHACTPNPAEPPSCGSCPSVSEPSGCVTTARHVACGHQPTVHQLNHLAQTGAMVELLRALMGETYQRGPAAVRARPEILDMIEPVALPAGVLVSGRRRWGWMRRSAVPLTIVGSPRP